MLMAVSDISNLSKFRRLKQHATQANVLGLVKVSPKNKMLIYYEEDILMQIFRKISLALWYLKESKLPSNPSWKMQRVRSQLNDVIQVKLLMIDLQTYGTSTFVIWTQNLY
jgi:hypothetical protein